jgi:hypothetical protein
MAAVGPLTAAHQHSPASAKGRYAVQTFVTIFDLALQLLTALPDSPMRRLTRHHHHGESAARATLQAAILQRAMPGEDPSTRWGVVRVFMRNLVNRAQAPMTGAAMLALLERISGEHLLESDRITALTQSVAGNGRLQASLGALLDTRRAPDGAQDYIEWLQGRVAFYSRMPVACIDADGLLHDLRCMASRSATKIPNMRIPLAANLLADLGVRVVGKPDLHVLPTISAAVGRSLSTEDCIRELIRIAQQEAPNLEADPAYAWLDGGLYPRDIDRVIYLFGSDNHKLDGDRDKHSAPARRQLMADAITRAGNPPRPRPSRD